MSKERLTLENIIVSPFIKTDLATIQKLNGWGWTKKKILKTLPKPKYGVLRK